MNFSIPCVTQRIRQKKKEEDWKNGNDSTRVQSSGGSTEQVR